MFALPRSNSSRILVLPCSSSSRDEFAPYFDDERETPAYERRNEEARCSSDNKAFITATEDIANSSPNENKDNRD